MRMVLLSWGLGLGNVLFRHALSMSFVGIPEFVWPLSTSRICPVFVLNMSTFCPIFVPISNLSRLCPQCPGFVLPKSKFCPKNFQKSNLCPHFVFTSNPNSWFKRRTISGHILDSIFLKIYHLVTLELDKRWTFFGQDCWHWHRLYIVKDKL